MSGTEFDDDGRGWRLPRARGPLSQHVVSALRRPPGTTTLRWVPPDDDDDEQLAVLVLQQLAFRRIIGVDPRWEEDASLHALLLELEAGVEARLRRSVTVPDVPAAQVPAALRGLLAASDGPSLSTWMAERGTIDHLRELVVHRAAYQLQEADPHSFAIPRLGAGTSKTALLELQLDEYGGHEPTEAHATLFAATMRALGLEPRADLDALPAVTLATNTLLNRFGRSRRLVGACLGHLAVFEMTSVEPMARYAAAVRRLVPGPSGTDAARFYDVHVAADALHAHLALDRLVTGFVEDHPDEATEVLFGAAALLAVEAAFTAHVLACWEVGQTSLCAPLPGSGLAGRWPALAER